MANQVAVYPISRWILHTAGLTGPHIPRGQDESRVSEMQPPLDPSRRTSTVQLMWCNGDRGRRCCKCLNSHTCNLHAYNHSPGKGCCHCIFRPTLKPLTLQLERLASQSTPHLRLIPAIQTCCSIQVQAGSIRSPCGSPCLHFAPTQESFGSSPRSSTPTHTLAKPWQVLSGLPVGHQKASSSTAQ